MVPSLIHSLPIVLISSVLELYAYDCPAPGGVYASCSKKAVYLIDTSTDLSSSEIQNEFNFIRNNIIPGTAWYTSEELAFCIYGTGNLQGDNTVSDMNQACASLNAKEDSYNAVGNNPVSLYKTLQAVNIHYPLANTVVLFSGSKNQTDIAEAGSFALYNMPDKVFTVVALYEANFTSFPAQAIYNVATLVSPPSNLVSCLVKNACDQAHKCDIFSAPDPPLYYPTTPSVSTQQPVVSECECNTSTVWLDIIFVFDASAAAGQTELNNMWGFVASMLDYYNIQKTNYTGSPTFTQVGVVTYGDTAHLVFPLGSVDLETVDGTFSLPYNGGLTNLEAGLEMANDQLLTSARRENARGVIVVMTTVYNPNGVNAPEKIAGVIKEDGVILMVYNYISAHGGVPAAELAGIASPGYFFLSNVNGTVDEYMNPAMCDANCFCPNNYQPYSASSDRGLPTGGCYVPRLLQSNQARSLNVCKSFTNNGGVLAVDTDAAKNAFLASLFPPGTSFWIGLTYSSLNSRWQWPDGTPLQSYQPWASGSPHDGSGDLTGVYVNSNQQWQVANPRVGYYCVCQLNPCDSMHYCDGTQ